jgi:hypothetical protein
MSPSGASDIEVRELGQAVGVGDVRDARLREIRVVGRGPEYRRHRHAEPGFERIGEGQRGDRLGQRIEGTAEQARLLTGGDDDALPAARPAETLSGLSPRGEGGAQPLQPVRAGGRAQRFDVVPPLTDVRGPPRLDLRGQASRLRREGQR